jgi:hypothetical protein
MNIETAICLINGLVYKPGWTFTATDHTGRFEGTVKVRVEYPAQNSDRADAPDGYPNAIVTYAEFPIVVGDCDSDKKLYRKLLNQLMKIEEHEAREFLRTKGTYWAPFHPHQINGMKSWQSTCCTDDDLLSDLQFGIG